MRKFPFVLLFIGGFLLLNSIYLGRYMNFLEGKDLYTKENYEGALAYFSGNTNQELYNSALAYYKAGKFLQAQHIFSKIDTADEDLNFQIAHNLGNTSFRLFEKNNDITFLDESIAHYKEALQIKEDDETRKNLQFVKQKKNDLEKPHPKPLPEGEGKEQESGAGEEDNRQTDEQTTEENTEKNTEGQEYEKNGEGKSEQEGEKTEGEETNSGEPEQGEENTENGGSSEQDSSSGKQESVFTKEQQQELEAYEQSLQNEQMQNAGNYGKVYNDPNRGETIFELFRGEPLFDDPFGNTGEQKDW